jgi:hypothetical protein
MKTIKSRIKKLELKINDSKSDYDTYEPTFEEEDELLRKYYPRHKWFKLPIEERRRIWSKNIPPGYTKNEWDILAPEQRGDTKRNSPDPEIRLNYEIHGLLLNALIKESEIEEELERTMSSK